WRIEDAAGRLSQPQQLCQRPRLLQHQAKSVRPTALDQIIGILPFRQKREAQRLACLDQWQCQIGCPPCSLETGLVAIETKDRLASHAPQKVQLILGQCGAERRYDILEAGL